MPLRWGAKEQAAFQQLKDLLCMDAVLAHFNPTLLSGILCDTSDVGIGVMLFQWYTDCSERPIANASKILTKCSQICSIVTVRHRRRFCHLPHCTRQTSKEGCQGSRNGTQLSGVQVGTFVHCWCTMLHLNKKLWWVPAVVTKVFGT